MTLAFQPIANVRARRIHAQEAPVRGLSNEKTAAMLSRLDDGNRYRFDHACPHVVEFTASLGLAGAPSINFVLNAVHRPEHCPTRRSAPCLRPAFRSSG